MTSEHLPDPFPFPALSSGGRAVLALLVIPVLVYICWIIEVWLLEGSLHLFRTPDPFGIMIYTIVGCILTGIIVPVLLMRRSFASGAVNMYQVGFRAPRRTIVMCTLTVIALCIVFLFLVPDEPARSAMYALCLLYLPTGIATVMVCWALVGTHLQALVRGGGVIISIATSVVITSVLFMLSLHAYSPEFSMQSTAVSAILLGIVTAIIFFAVRDVYAAVIAVTSGTAYLLLGAGFPAAAITGPVLPAASVCALGALIGVHVWLLHRYATVMVVPDR
jgi:hypothetical protein